MQQKKSKISYIILFAGILFLLFVTIKSARTSFTHDESFSYTHYVHTGFMDIVSYKNPYTNNHILNSLLMKYSEILFGSSELALRLPNILLFVVYMLFTFLIFKKSNPLLNLCMLVLVLAHPYLIDFFGLARGYGLSIGFLVMSLFFLLEFFRTNENKNLVFFNTAALFSMLSSFTLLYFYLGALIIFNIVKFMEYFIFKLHENEKYKFFKINKINIIQFIIAFIVLYEPVRKVIKFNLIDFGGKEGFVHNTVVSLINGYFYDIYCYHFHSLATELIKIFVLIVVFGSLFIILKNTFQKNKEFFNHHLSLIVVNFILFFIVIESLINHYLFKTDYIIIRFALFLFPLFILNLGFLIEYLLTFKYRKIILSVTVVLTIASAINFCSLANFNSYNEWEYDMATKKIMKELITYHEKNEADKNNVKVGITWLFEPAMNYYRLRWKLDWLQPLDRNGLTEEDNFEYILLPDSANIKKKNYTILFSSEKINSELLKIN